MDISSESKKAGIIPPDDPSEFEKWRKSLDPDSMGFDGKEVNSTNGTDNKRDSNNV